MPDAFAPLQSGAHLIAPASLRLLPTFLLSLAAIAFLTHRRGEPLAGSQLFLRWRTWLVILPVWLASVASHLGAAFLVVALSVQAVREFSRLVGLARPLRRLLLATAVVSAPLALLDFASWRALPPLLLLAATAVVMMSCEREEAVRQLGLVSVGLVYLPYLLTYIVLLRSHERAGPGMLLLLGVAVAASDIAAFVFGSALKGRRLAPGLSPNKTWSGVAGNLVGASVATVAFRFAVPDVPIWLLAAVPVAIAASAVWGDLLESMFKRTFGAKDAGAWLPGFGGLLDRIDSLLVAAPVLYTLVVVVGGVAADGWL